MPSITKKHLIDQFLKEVESGDAAIFAGAGLSVSAGFVDWKGLLKDLADELNLDIEQEYDLVSLAQFHVNAAVGNKYRLQKVLIENFTKDARPTPNHLTLARLPISTWWTTNFDQLIEEALRGAGKIVDVKWDVSHLSNTKPRRDAIVYKMHGDISLPDSAVLTRNDYETFEKERGAFTNALAGDLVSKTFLFIGFSFTDPNLDHVLSRVRITFKNNQRRHFAIFKKRTKGDHESDEQFRHAEARQLLVVEDLKRFNIHVLFIDEYKEIEEILASIDYRYRRKSAFISSSASVFEPWGEDQVTAFMHELGSALIGSGTRVVTGLGLGVGNSLFSGAAEQVLRAGSRHIEDAITARPFPQAIADKEERGRIWDKFRVDLIGSAGIAIFLFGNKIQAGRAVPADGMRREYEIAQESGLAVMPIGATGGTAKELADLAAADPAKNLTSLSEPERAALLELNQHTDVLVDLVPKIIRLVRSVQSRY